MRMTQIYEQPQIRVYLARVPNLFKIISVHLLWVIVKPTCEVHRILVQLLIDFINNNNIYDTWAPSPIIPIVGDLECNSLTGPAWTNLRPWLCPRGQPCQREERTCHYQVLKGMILLMVAQYVAGIVLLQIPALSVVIVRCHNHVWGVLKYIHS